MNAKEVALAYTGLIGEMYANSNIDTIAYSEAWKKVFPGKPFGRKSGASGGPHLIEVACQNLNWPQLNVLFVKKDTGEPGEGHSTSVDKKYNWKEELKKAKNFRDFDENILKEAISKALGGHGKSNKASGCFSNLVKPE